MPSSHRGSFQLPLNSVKSRAMEISIEPAASTFSASSPACTSVYPAPKTTPVGEKSIA